MYLSRIFLPWYPGQNPYNWHQQIWDFFPKESKKRNEIKIQKEANGERIDFPVYFLFRIEEVTPGKGAIALIQSPEIPEVSDQKKLMQGPGLLTYRDVVNGTNAKFILTANPVKMKCADQNRVPHIGEENLLKWLNGKIHKFGLLVGNIKITPGKPIYFRKRNNAGKINPVTFEGQIQITNKNEFLNTAFKGIGPAKAFGCGLLLVKPV